ncbi:hypothetical protein D3C73_1568750 [compost metagenome]
MIPQWGTFLSELREMTQDARAAAYLNSAGLAGCLDRLGSEPAPNLIFNTDFRLLTRGLVFYRFLKRLS